MLAGQEQGIEPAEHVRGRAVVAGELVAQHQVIPAGLLAEEILEDDDVAPAEGIDRLLGVADDDHGNLADEGLLEDGPLCAVGVLELIDEDEAEGVGQGRG